jgi:hypothetical protein
MMGDYHVRFCEGPGVKFHRPTRQTRQSDLVRLQSKIEDLL